MFTCCEPIDQKKFIYRSRKQEENQLRRRRQSSLSQKRRSTSSNLTPTKYLKTPKRSKQSTEKTLEFYKKNLTIQSTASKPKSIEKTPPQDKNKRLLKYDEIRYGNVIEKDEEHEAYRLMMLSRLSKVNMTEEEYEKLIRMNKKGLISFVKPVKLKKLMIVINKFDFMENFEFNIKEYQFYEEKFDLKNEKLRYIYNDERTIGLSYYLDKILKERSKSKEREVRGVPEDSREIPVGGTEFSFVGKNYKNGFQEDSLEEDTIGEDTLVVNSISKTHKSNTLGGIKLQKGRENKSKTDRKKARGLDDEVKIDFGTPQTMKSVSPKRVDTETRCIGNDLEYEPERIYGPRSPSYNNKRRGRAYPLRESSINTPLSRRSMVNYSPNMGMNLPNVSTERSKESYIRGLSLSPNLSVGSASRQIFASPVVSPIRQLPPIQMPLKRVIIRSPIRMTDFSPLVPQTQVQSNYNPYAHFDKNIYFSPQRRNSITQINEIDTRARIIPQRSTNIQRYSVDLVRNTDQRIYPFSERFIPQYHQIPYNPQTNLNLITQLNGKESVSYRKIQVDNGGNIRNITNLSNRGLSTPLQNYNFETFDTLDQENRRVSNPKKMKKVISKNSSVRNSFQSQKTNYRLNSIDTVSKDYFRRESSGYENNYRKLEIDHLKNNYKTAFRETEKGNIGDEGSSVLYKKGFNLDEIKKGRSEKINKNNGNNFNPEANYIKNDTPKNTNPYMTNNKNPSPKDLKENPYTTNKNNINNFNPGVEFDNFDNGGAINHPNFYNDSYYETSTPLRTVRNEDPRNREGYRHSGRKASIKTQGSNELKNDIKKGTEIYESIQTEVEFYLNKQKSKDQKPSLETEDLQEIKERKVEMKKEKKMEEIQSKKGITEEYRNHSKRVIKLNQSPAFYRRYEEYKTDRLKNARIARRGYRDSRHVSYEHTHENMPFVRERSRSNSKGKKFGEYYVRSNRVNRLGGRDSIDRQFVYR